MRGFFSNGEKLERVGSRSPKISSFAPKGSSLISGVGVLTRFGRFFSNLIEKTAQSFFFPTTPDSWSYSVWSLRYGDYTKNMSNFPGLPDFHSGHAAHKPHTLKDRSVRTAFRKLLLLKGANLVSSRLLGRCASRHILGLPIQPIMPDFATFCDKIDSLIARCWATCTSRQRWKLILIFWALIDIFVNSRLADVHATWLAAFKQLLPSAYDQ